MAVETNPAAQASQPQAAVETREVDEFATLLKQSFKPRTERAEAEVENAVTTLVQQALADQSVIKTDVLDEHPWVARNLYNAFLESKRRSIERLLDPAVSRYPLAWLPTYARNMRDMFDGDPFPYGIEENRPTLEQFLRYTHEQGIARRRARAEEIFPKGIMTAVKV